jgi:competence protein ComEA
MSLRERWDTLSRGELAGLIVVIVATLAGVGFWYSRSLPRPTQVAETPAPAQPASGSGGAVVDPSASPGSSASPATQVIVDVAGLVRKPGVYALDPGSRVVDAIDRAGGALPRADLSLLNLAAPLVDGQQILVQKEGASAGTGATGTPSTVGGTLVNINTADEPTLETLNGVGPSLATAIIQYRTEHGPFTSVDQLDQVSGIGPATLEKLRPQVTV